MTKLSRHKAIPTDRASAAKPGHARTALAILMAVGMLALATLLTASAQGGSGGVGTSSGGDSGGQRESNRYARAWKRFPRRDRRWAHRTSQCEAGQDPRIHGGGGSFHGAFQFMKSTWRSSPASPGGDPHRYSWKTQAVVAVKLKRRDGAGHWPNCG